MRSRRSVIRAILFVVRLQKSLAAHQVRRVNRPLLLRRCASTRASRRGAGTSSDATLRRKRNSAPSAPTGDQRQPTPQFAAFSFMSQPYALGLIEQRRGGLQMAVLPGAAHQLAMSRALLRRQPSLDERKRSSADASTRRSQRQASVDSKDENAPRKKQKQQSPVNMVAALCAVEQDEPATLRAILSQTEPKNLNLNERLDVGQYAEMTNEWTLFDVALHLKHLQVARLLQQFGAVENSDRLGTLSQRMKAVEEALLKTQHNLKQFRDRVALTKEEDKQLEQLNGRLKVYRRMRLTLENGSMPDRPQKVTAQVASSHSISVNFEPPEYDPQHLIILKYKVEWSKQESFARLDGSQLITNGKTSTILITGLETNQRYSIRVSAAGLWGYGAPAIASPSSITVSSWESVENVKGGMTEQVTAITELLVEVDKYRQSPLWETVFPSSNEPNVRKKRLGLKQLFTTSSKFLKNVHKGVCLATVIYTEEKVLCTVDDCLPVLMIDEGATQVNRDDLHWLLKFSLCWDQIAVLQQQEESPTTSASMAFRSRVLETVQQMHNALGVKSIGRLHHEPISVVNGPAFLVTVMFINDTQPVQGLAVKWNLLSKFVRKRSLCSAFEQLSTQLISTLNFFESSQIPLDRGLYLAYLKLHSGLSQIRVVVPENLPSVLPFACIRDNPHVTREEWAWLRVLDLSLPIRPTIHQAAFHRALVLAARVLLRDLDVDGDQVATHRLYRYRMLQVNDDVSFILVVPKVEDVCSAPSAAALQAAAVAEQRRGCASLPVPVFEMIHLYTYQPDFIVIYCRLSVFLEHFIMTIQYLSRRCLLEADQRVYADQLEQLQGFQLKLEAIWKEARWISSIAWEARDRRANCSGLPLGVLFAANLRSAGGTSTDLDEPGYQSDQGGDPSLSPSHSVGRRLTAPRPADSSPDLERLFISAGRRQTSPAYSDASSSASAPQLKNNNDSSTASSPGGIVRVYAAYPCGLARGTSVRLQIGSSTTAREVVMLVVEQLTKAAAMVTANVADSGREDNPNTDLFCLVAVIGTRERQLKDEFPPLRLQNPWAKGRLYVRRRDAVLAAVSKEAAV